MKFSKKIGKNTVFLRKGKEMTQRIFDIFNEKDMADLWDALSERIIKIKRKNDILVDLIGKKFDDDNFDCMNCPAFNIDWHDKAEITRPVQEVTKADVGKICVFWDDNPDSFDNIGILTCISDCYATLNGKVEFEKNRYLCGGISWKHCRRLTKEEVSELC